MPLVGGAVGAVQATTMNEVKMVPVMNATMSDAARIRILYVNAA